MTRTPGEAHWVGDGFPVRTVFHLREETDPFLMLDYAGPAHFEPSDKPRGVEEHPHRGFETVTIAYQGSVDHRDSGGNSGTIHPGDVQWMTAASGVVHEEKHGEAFTKAGGDFEMVQLWVNLPKAHKMSSPRYQSIASAQIPLVELGPGAEGRVIAGVMKGVEGPARTFTPVNVFDVRMKAGGRAELELPAGHNSSVVLLRGDIVVNGETLRWQGGMAVLSSSGEQVTIDANEESLILVLSGEPIKEPVASYGPFVMNTQDEVWKAFEDYRAGRMGRLA